MGKWIHRLTDINEIDRSAVCAECGPVTIRRHNKNGWRCNMRDNHGSKGAYRIYKGDRCQRCGFIAEHSCQLDVHHKDHNHKNDDPGNLETLCANCHRLNHFG